ncbi:alpha/beta hydrolase [Cumulibacter manganitolerans]|uniref:alpha/beta hydrolase n=1 Tax=Cumulibacter manganitolerans TaxID=1884992 RepID=UPI001296B767|nr:alpha/beta hydrolase [Cumulibacter manganitolerans]
MDTATFIAAAGVDPYAKADEIVTARPAEVSALGAAFLAAAEALSESGSTAGVAAQLADASTAFDGAAPTDLLSEVAAVQAALHADPSRLAAIGAPLCALAEAIYAAQLCVGDLLADLEQQCVAVVLAYRNAAASAPATGVDPRAAYTAEGAGIVQAVHAQIAARVDQHDAVAAEVLAALQDAGYLMPPDVDATTGGGMAGPQPWQCPAIPQGSPAQTAAWWAGLSPQQQAAWLQQRPAELAAVAGLPAAVYDLVNRRELADDGAAARQQVAAALADLTACGAYDEAVARGIITSPEDLFALGADEALQISELSNEAALAMSVLLASATLMSKIHGTETSIAAEPGGPPRYLLEYDLDDFGGDGTAVIALGDVDAAEHVAVLVQGATHDLTSIAGQTASAAAVLGMMDELGAGSNAVVVYEGYDNPTLPEALSGAQAVAGAGYLLDDLAGWQAAHQQATGTAAHTTLIGHSYGTVVASYAMQQGGSGLVDDLVVYGSPGLAVEDVGELGLPGAHVFAALDPDDVLQDLANLEQQLGAPSLYGVDPADPSFGGTVLSTWGVDGHGDYFGYQDGQPTDTLHSAGAVAAGAYGQARVR